MPVPTSRIPQLGPRKSSGGSGSSSSSAATARASFLPLHPQSKLAHPGDASLLPPPTARLARSHSSPLSAPPARFTNNQRDERPQLSIQVPHAAYSSSGNNNSASGVTSPASYSSYSNGDTESALDALAPPSPSTHTDNIRVLLRIRPPNPSSDAERRLHQTAAAAAASRRCLDVAPDAKGVTLAPATLQEKRFGFDRVFAETSSQEQVFLDVGVAAVENTVHGFNGCIFAYGQTGSGKTFTMLGDTSAADVRALQASPLRGLTPRIFERLFRRLSHAAAAEKEGGSALEYELSCSYLEIYNEKIFDLLEENSALAAQQQPKSLREDASRGVYVEQLREVAIQSEVDAIEWLQLGSSNRRMAATDMNRESSRSHAVFTIKLVQTERTASGVLLTRRSNLHLVDLAGSEKQRQTKAAGQRLKEAAQINKSLSALGNVIMSLVDVSNGQKRHVHYRDSKLTFLLKDSLGGNAITTIVATISGEEKYFSETLSTLKFAQRAKYIKNKPVQNQDADSMLPLLKLEIERLRQEIAQLKAGGPSPTLPSSPDGFKSSSSNNQHQQYWPQHQQQLMPQPEVKKNRWEPALEVMDKLLRASGAATPADVEDPEECNPVEIRCERLEMLLYRMICRYEEHKAFAFSSDRQRHGHAFRRPVVLMKSNLRAPKKYSVTQTTENQQPEGRFLSPSEEKVIYEELARGNELERENNLMRQELCELLEWKALVEDERKNGNADANGYSAGFPMDVAAQTQNEELMELLSVYRSIFDDLSDAMQTKRPLLSSPSSPRSGSSYTEDNSVVSYASGGEEDGDGDSRDFGTDDNDGISEDGEVSETYREIRRAHSLGLKFERKLEHYQDTMQRLEKDLLATQDELETSSAATKFAEFQLQQLRDLASEEEARHTALESTAAQLRSDVERFQLALNDSQLVIESKDRALKEAINATQSAHKELDHLRSQLASAQQDASEIEKLRTLLASTQKDVEELAQLRTMLASAQGSASELEEVRAQLKNSQQDAGEKNHLLDGVNAQLSACRIELESLRSSVAAYQQESASKDHALEETNAKLSACKHELEALKSTRVASQVELDAKDHALEDATAQLKALKMELESLRFELLNAQQDLGSKEHVLEEANNKLHANRLELETLRSSLTNSQSEIDSKSRALEDVRSQLETSHHNHTEVEELRSALAAARRAAKEKTRALDDVQYQLENFQLERDEMCQRFTHEKEMLKAKHLKMIRDYEAREKEQDAEIRRLREEAATASASDGPEEVVRLRRKSKSSEQEKAGVELALLAAQSIIQQLEDELAVLRAGGSGGDGVLVSAGGDAAGGSSSTEREQMLQSKLDTALAENAELRETIRSLQTEEKSKSKINQRKETTNTTSRNSTSATRNAAQAEADDDDDGLANEAQRHKSSVQGEDALPPSHSLLAISNQNTEIRRLNSRLRTTLQKMTRLEEELTRSHNSYASSRNLTTEFFWEM